MALGYETGRWLLRPRGAAHAIRSAARITLPLAGGMQLLLISPDGEISHSEGDREETNTRNIREFVGRVMQQGDPWVLSETAGETEALDPIRPDSKTLAAVRGFGGQILGVLDMAAAEEFAFAPAWQEVLRYVADLIALHHDSEIGAQGLALRQQIASAAIYREIRHRIGTHAQVLSMQTSELLSGDVDRSLDARRLRAIKRSADSIASIVRDLRDIAREPTLHLTDGHRVSALIAEAAEQSAARHSKNDGPKTKHIWREPLFDCWIRADPQELKYSLECVLDNAWEAIRERYRQDPNCQEGWAGVIKIGAQKDGEGVSLTISDNGIGFESREKNLLFSPLHSTKTRMTERKE